VKIATWNVNGIRARQAQFCEWLARDRPDIVCLQELKAEPAQIPEVCKVADYHAFWHGMRAYSGVSLHIRKGAFETEPVFSHPAFDMESRIVQAELGSLVVASVYVPNGNKDYAAKIEFVKRLIAWASGFAGQGKDFILCGDMNITHTERDVHPRERKPGIIGQRAEERELFSQLLASLVDVGRSCSPTTPTCRRRAQAAARQRRHVHVVGAVAEHAPAQHRLAPGLCARLAFGRGARHELPGAGGGRHQRPRAGDDDYGVASITTRRFGASQSRRARLFFSRAHD
jgi:exodeoxyribonuclease III